LNVRTNIPYKRPWINRGLLLVGIWCFTVVSLQAQIQTFHSILTKNQTQLTPLTSFSLKDRIYLHTVWTGLKGDHEIKVLWIRPDKTVQETSRFTIKIPPDAQNYTTWAWLFFKKGLLNISAIEEKFIGPWKARLFLDDKSMAEYGFSVR
jgi:hypothetical protein